MSNVFPLTPYFTKAREKEPEGKQREARVILHREDRSGITMGVGDRSVAEKPEVKACQEDKNDSASHPQSV